MADNLLQTAATWLGDKLATAAGRTVTIQQGMVQLPGIIAWPALHQYEVVDESGFLLKILSYDWTFRRVDLIQDGELIELRESTYIREILEGVEQVYEGMPLGKRPAWEMLDSAGKLFVFHTKQVSLS